MARESRSQIGSDQEQAQRLMELVMSGKSMQDALAELGLASKVADDSSLGNKPRRELLSKSEAARNKEKLREAKNKKYTDFKSNEERAAFIEEAQKLIEESREKGYTPIIKRDPDNPGQYIAELRPHLYVSDELAQDLRYNTNMLKYVMNKEEKLAARDKVQHSTDTDAMNAMYDFAMDNRENPGYGELNFTMKVSPEDVKKGVARVAFSDNRPTELSIYDADLDITYPYKQKNYIEVEVPVNKQLRYLFDITDQLNGGDVENGGNVKYAADYTANTQDKSDKTQAIYDAMRNGQDFRPIYGDNGLYDVGSLFYTNPEEYHRQLIDSRKAVAADILGIPREDVGDDDIELLMSDHKFKGLFAKSVDELIARTDKAERGRPKKVWEDTDIYKELSDKLKRNRSLLNTYVKDSDIRYGDDLNTSSLFRQTEDDPYDLARRSILQSIYSKNPDITIPELINEFYSNKASGINPDLPGLNPVSIKEKVLDPLIEELGLQRSTPDKVIKPNPNAPEPKRRDFYGILNPMLKFIDVLEQNPKAADRIIAASGDNELLKGIRDSYNSGEFGQLKDILYLYAKDPSHWYNQVSERLANEKQKFDYDQAKLREQHLASAGNKARYFEGDKYLRDRAREQEALANRLENLEAINASDINDIKAGGFNSPEELKTAIDTVRDKLLKHGKFNLEDPAVQKKIARAKELGMNDLVTDIYSNIDSLSKLKQYERIMKDKLNKNGRMTDYNRYYDIDKNKIIEAPGGVDEANIGVDKPRKNKKIILDVINKKSNYNVAREALDKLKTGRAAATQMKEYELTPDQLTDEQKQRMIDRRRELMGEFTVGRGKSNEEVKQQMEARKRKLEAKKQERLKKSYEVPNTPTTDQDIKDVYNAQATQVYDPYENEEKNDK